jgi:hypothetical protein
VAAEKGDVAKAKALLDSGEEHAEPPATTCSTQSPFKRASGMGHMKHKTLTVDHTHVTLLASTRKCIRVT